MTEPRPDLVVGLPDGRTIVRRAPAPIFPDPQDWETWARFLAQRLTAMLNDPGGDTVEAIARRYAVRDAARDALLGFAQWSETPFTVTLIDGC